MKTTAIIQMVSSLKKLSWKPVWAGDWTLLPCSDWGEFYTRDLSILGKPFVSEVIYVFKNGKVNCWLPEKEIDTVAQRLALYVGLNRQKAKGMSESLRSETDKALYFMKHNDPARMTLPMFEKYLRTIRRYYQFHIPIKYVVDGMSPVQLRKFLSILQKARVYAEPVFDKTLLFDHEMSKSLSKKSGIRAEHILFMTKDELRQYFTKGSAPTSRTLATRGKKSILVFIKGKSTLFIGEDVQLVEAALAPFCQKGFIRGASAYPGIVKGIARVIYDPRQVKLFNKGIFSSRQ